MLDKHLHNYIKYKEYINPKNHAIAITIPAIVPKFVKHEFTTKRPNNSLSHQKCFFITVIVFSVSNINGYSVRTAKTSRYLIT